MISNSYYVMVILFLDTALPISHDGRTKRSLVEFSDVIQCATGRSGSFSSFNNYGCFCGFGGRGKPVDEIDRCCDEHDHCYEKTRKSHCNILSIYTTPYKWECQMPNQPKQQFLSTALRSLNPKVIARNVVNFINSTVFHPTVKQKGIPICLDSSSECGNLLCKCDMLAALCYASYIYPEQKPKCKYEYPAGTIISTENSDE